MNANYFYVLTIIFKVYMVLAIGLYSSGKSLFCLVFDNERFLMQLGISLMEAC